LSYQERHSFRDRHCAKKKKKRITRDPGYLPHEPGFDHQAAFAGTGMDMLLRYFLAIV
jgi:hypothetical protein